MNPWFDTAIVVLAVVGAIAYTIRWFRRARRDARSGGCGSKTTSCRCPKSAVASNLDAAAKGRVRPGLEDQDYSRSS